MADDDGFEDGFSDEDDELKAIASNNNGGGATKSNNLPSLADSLKKFVDKDEDEDEEEEEDVFAGLSDEDDNDASSKPPQKTAPLIINKPIDYSLVRNLNNRSNKNNGINTLSSNGNDNNININTVSSNDKNNNNNISNHNNGIDSITQDKQSSNGTSNNKSTPASNNNIKNKVEDDEDFDDFGDNEDDADSDHKKQNSAPLKLKIPTISNNTSSLDDSYDQSFHNNVGFVSSPVPTNNNNNRSLFMSPVGPIEVKTKGRMNLISPASIKTQFPYSPSITSTTATTPSSSLSLRTRLSGLTTTTTTTTMSENEFIALATAIKEKIDARIHTFQKMVADNDHITQNEKLSGLAANYRASARQSLQETRRRIDLHKAITREKNQIIEELSAKAKELRQQIVDLDKEKLKRLQASQQRLPTFLQFMFVIGLLTILMFLPNWLTTTGNYPHYT
eukprot:TRINITY_DN3204_c0_g4_i1.p1 TRINITY_DN3204_c0_g4~~TRINITY_DN3204_c0_g4_i1.p1  ORF type:complete len:458 (-),score=158.48 TRINITY_DN3204_c0_g4_i1:64-1410(-)